MDSSPDDFRKVARAPRIRGRRPDSHQPCTTSPPSPVAARLMTTSKMPSGFSGGKIFRADQGRPSTTKETGARPEANCWAVPENGGCASSGSSSNFSSAVVTASWAGSRDKKSAVSASASRRTRGTLAVNLLPSGVRPTIRISPGRPVRALKNPWPALTVGWPPGAAKTYALYVRTRRDLLRACAMTAKVLSPASSTAVPENEITPCEYSKARFICRTEPSDP